MKALIISDLHSNLQALEAVWQKEKDADAIYCAGDLTDIGPNPNEVIEWLRDHNAHCIAGNHDEYLIDLMNSLSDHTNTRETNGTWLTINADQIKPENLNYLKDLPKSMDFSLDGQNYYMTHKYVDYEIIRSKFQLEQFLDAANKPHDTILIFGHTHQQNKTWFAENRLMLNPGSTSYRTFREPLDTNRKAEYITITNTKIELKGADYDTLPFFEEILKYKNHLNANEFKRAVERYGPQNYSFE